MATNLLKKTLEKGTDFVSSKRKGPIIHYQEFDTTEEVYQEVNNINENKFRNQKTGRKKNSKMRIHLGKFKHRIICINSSIKEMRM
jgi:hypothetical protein